MVFGGNTLQTMRILWCLALSLACAIIWKAYSQLDVTDTHFQTRKLSNDANGVGTLFRPDELQIRSEALWIISIQFAVLVGTKILCAEERSRLKANFSDPSLH